MKIDVNLDLDTFGLAAFYNAPMKDERAPAFLKHHTITIIIGILVVAVSW